MYKITIKLISIITVVGLFSACNGDYEETVIEEDAATEEVVITETENSDDFVFPSPTRIAEIFKRAGLIYLEDLTNDPENVVNYTTKKDQKLNYGVYSADMAYCVTNNQTQKSIDYLSTLRTLSEKIWLTDIIATSSLSERIEDNLGNLDSLAFIMADLQMQIDDYIDENKLGYTNTIIFAGAWIESMYIGSKINENKRNEKLINRLSEQGVILESLIGSIQQNDNSNEYASLLKDLIELKKTFDDFEVNEDEDTVMSDDAVKMIGKQITTIRSKIIGIE